MRIDVSEIGERSFYEELVYLTLVRKNIINGKDFKLYTVAEYYRKYILFTGASILLMFVFHLLFKNGIFLVLSGMMMLLLAYEIVSLNNFNRYINDMMSEKYSRYVDINEDGIVFNDGRKNISLTWDDIKAVIFGKYSISFFPKRESDYIISLEAKYKETVSDCLKQHDKTFLILKKENQ